ncbi:MAG: SGNH/GDSL hydrolase family protein [Eubacteriales bacterium]|nr:SGNH/GDSL hydrolase family protein [Eubacteriales bacterium]
MKKLIINIVMILLITPVIHAQNIGRDIRRAKGEVNIVVYGASVVASSAGKYWVNQLFSELNKRYPDKLNCYNVSMSGMNSFWATENFKDSVLVKKPDVLIFGFCENDCVERFNFWPWYSGRCAEYMIDKLKEQNPDAAVIMYIMSEKPLGNAAETRPEIKAFNDSYREVAKKRDIILIDFSEDFNYIYNTEGEKGLKSYQPDGIMPTKKASDQIIVPGLLKAMKMK